jgi:hypothetical protein
MCRRDCNALEIANSELAVAVYESNVISRGQILDRRFKHAAGRNSAEEGPRANRGTAVMDVKC